MDTFNDRFHHSEEPIRFKVGFIGISSGIQNTMADKFYFIKS